MVAARFNSKMLTAVLLLLVGWSAPVSAQAPAAEGKVPALIQGAKALRASGDTTTALGRLRQALAIAPNNPTVICEMALTYEVMGLTSKAAAHWERLVAMGDATPYFRMAQEHLRPTPSPEEAQLDGFAPGSSLRLMDLNLQRYAQADKLTLKIPIKTRHPVDAGDVVIQVIFFDLLADAEVSQTSAIVSHRFTTAPVDWLENGLEILCADYSLPEEQKSGRKYFGYSVTLYYKNFLQDKRAEPNKLLEMYPPPLQLDSQDNR